MAFETRLPFTLRLAGPVALLRADGGCATPRSMKQRALLVLLATGPGMRRGRAFLQDKLWSASDQRRGGASLRQALTELRRGLGADRDILIADAEAVALDPRRVRVDLRGPGRSGEPVEFAEGLDVADPECEHWLRDRRTQFAASREAPHRMPAPRPAPPPAARPALLALPPVCGDETLRVQGEILTSDIAARIARLGAVDVLIDPRARPGGDHLAIRVRAVRQGNEARFQAELVDVAGSRIVWTGAARPTLEGFLASSEPIDRLAREAAAAAIAHLGRLDAGDGLDPQRLPFQMLTHFPFHDSPRLGRLRDWLAADATPDPPPIHLAWRARLELVRYIERSADHATSLRAATAFSREALAKAPDDGTVLAIAGEVALHGGRPQLACELTRKALERTPGAAYAMAVHAQALARSGRLEDGHATARRALGRAGGQPNVAWWHGVAAVTAMLNGYLEDARAHAEMAHLLAPGFRPPLRFLGALRFRAGDEAGTAAALRELKALEPGFCLRDMADADYPVATLRKTGLLAVTRSALL